MRIRPMAAEDVDRVVPAWNAALVHDQVTEEQFRQVMLEDPNYESGGVVIAEGPSGEVLGLGACVLRRTPEGKDGGGRDWEFLRGFLKGFFVVDGQQGEVAAPPLLAAAEAYCSAAGKRELMVSEYSGPYVFPGIDVRYHRLPSILAQLGYRDVDTIEDVGVDLRGTDLASRREAARARFGPEHTILTWEPGLMPAMRKFVAEGNSPQWFPVGWESGLARPRERAFVLRKGDEILGWAQYWPGQPRAGFGPILVLPRARGRGYGAALLLECMVRAREGGAEHMDAGWANTGFYTANGWHIIRRYAVLNKELTEEPPA